MLKFSVKGEVICFHAAQGILDSPFYRGHPGKYVLDETLAAISHANHDLRTNLELLNERFQNRRIVLTICIHGNHIFATKLGCTSKAGVDGLIIAPVNSVPDYCRTSFSSKASCLVA